MKKKLGIYIHIPFCTSRCFYCDFYSNKIDDNTDVNQYIDCICEEIINNVEVLNEYEVDTIYFGGGTPSAINAQYIKQIMDHIANCTTISSDCEITIEINPETCTTEKLNTYIACGINRISMGLQSVNNSTLKLIGRASTFEDFKRAYDTVKKTGITNISLDVITGLPNETLDDFIKTLDYVKTLGIKHVSAYSLEVHENTKLDFLVKAGFVNLPSDDIERDMKHLLDSELSKLSYTNYEISNYAIKGFESRHNLRYWDQEEYLGFGASASSFLNSMRYKNISCIKEYEKRIEHSISCTDEVEELNLLDKMKEYIILKLRLIEGVNMVEFKKRFKEDIYALFANEIEECITNGLLEKNNDNLFLTVRGKDVANVVWQKFI